MPKADALLMAALLVAAPTARAAGDHPPPALQDVMRRAAYNQLGLLRYCRDLGAVPAEAIAPQAALAAAWPEDDAARAAEAAGRRGLVDTDAGPLPLARAAERQKAPVPELCRRLAMRAQEAADAGRRRTGLQ